MIVGNVIYCDCCGTQKLAEIVGENLVIKDRRHGEKHLAVIPVKRFWPSWLTRPF